MNEGRRKFLLSGAAAVAAPLIAPFEALANTESLGVFGARGNAELIRESGIRVHRSSSEVQGQSVDLLEFRKDSEGGREYLYSYRIRMNLPPLMPR